MSFPLLVVVVLVLVVLAAAAFALKRKGAGLGAAADVYYLRKTLVTPAERSYLGVLDSVLPADVRVFGKVRLEDFLGVKSGLDRGVRLGARNRINRKHVDFLLVRSSDLAPLAGIELDDKSHDQDDRQERDAFVDSAFASAGLPLLHVPVQKAYSSNEVRAAIHDLLKPKG